MVAEMGLAYHPIAPIHTVHPSIPPINSQPSSKSSHFLAILLLAFAFAFASALLNTLPKSRSAAERLDGAT